MTLLASSCARCGVPVPEPSGAEIPTCSRCAELLQRRLQPEAEAARRCPVHGVVLAKEIVHQIVVDRCPACGGVWLDGGELDLLRRALQGGASDPLARTVVLGLTGSS